MRRRRCSTSRLSSRRRGAVLIVMIVAMSLLVGLIFFVFNLGDQINSRIAVQSAADSSAISATTWLARSSNVIAMNNVAEAKLLSIVPVYDAIPLAAEVARKELDASGGMLDALRDQLARGLPTEDIATCRLYNVNGKGELTGAGESWRFLDEGLKRILEEITPRLTTRNTTAETHYQRLVQLDEALNSDDELEPESGAFEVGRVTNWGDSSGRGELWQAAMALREMSEATAESAATIAQRTAGEFGRANGARSAFVLPIPPQPPYRVGTFEDFLPVLLGRMRVRSESADIADPMPIEGIVKRINQIDEQIERIRVDVAVVDVEIAKLRQDEPDEEEDAKAHTTWEKDLQRQVERRASLLDRIRRLDDEKENTFSRMHNRCPGGVVPDAAFPHRLGPYAKLYKWRFEDYDWGGGWSRTVGGGGQRSGVLAGSDPDQSAEREVPRRVHGLWPVPLGDAAHAVGLRRAGAMARAGRRDAVHALPRNGLPMRSWPCCSGLRSSSPFATPRSGSATTKRPRSSLSIRPTPIASCARGGIASAWPRSTNGRTRPTG